MKRFIATLLCLVLLLGLFPATASAASYPYIQMTSDWNMKIPKGNMGLFTFIIFPEYKYEKIHVKIYDKYGSLLSHTEKEIYNSSILSRDFSLTLNSNDWDYGTYTLEYYMSFYTYYTWHDCPSTHKVSFTITKPCSNQAHSYNNGKITQEATCEKDGTKTYTCNTCGATKTESIPKGNHVWDAGTIITAANCQSTGLKRYTCTICSTTKDESIAPTEHNMVNGICSVCGFDLPFTDVKLADWYYEAIKFAYNNNLFNGTSSNAFSPNKTMTRAMLVTVLWRYAGSPDEGNSTFSDVKSDAYYAKAVAWASANNVVNGVGNNRFNPDGTITREQMATILFRYAYQFGYYTDERAELSSFPDGNTVSGYAVDALSWAVGMELINGSNGKLLPQSGATRAQVATILMRFIENCRLI